MTTNTLAESQTIGEMVAEDLRASEILSKYGIDFCCGGHRSLHEAATEKNLDASNILKEIEALKSSKTPEAINFKSWPPDLLTDYIVKKHHRFVEDESPRIGALLEKLCKVHGANHPELHDIQKHFTALGGELAAHMKKEELMLFPFIHKLVKAARNHKEVDHPISGKLEGCITRMEDDHEEAGGLLKEIDRLTNHFEVPADGCATYREAYRSLKDFEADLHMHIHLENNILFPMATALDTKMNTRHDGND